MFIRGESEELVLDDWAANRPAVDLHIRAAEISLVGADRPRDGGIGDRVESWVAPASYGRAVERVGPGLHVQNNHAAGTIAILRVDGVFLESHLLHGVHRGGVRTLVT